MNRSLKNTAAVLFATVLTALAIVGGVQVAEVVAGTATVGATPVASGYTTVASNVPQSSGTLVCPRTNCTASTCHATTGRPPGQ